MMMKAVFFVFCLIANVSLSLQIQKATDCTFNKPEMKTVITDLGGTCESAVRDQIKREMDASVLYLSLGSHFSRATINRPGFADFFFEAAGEERQHAIKLMSYLLMRGYMTENLDKLIPKLTAGKVSDQMSGLEALEAALQREKEVTENIKDLIKKCDVDQERDYHITDYLTGDFLEEQYRGQRDIAGKIVTLQKMNNDHKSLGEFLFDKKIMDK